MAQNPNPSSMPLTGANQELAEDGISPTEENIPKVSLAEADAKPEASFSERPDRIRALVPYQSQTGEF